MEITNRSVSLRVLEAAPGHWLVHKDAEPQTAHYADRVYLGSGDSPDNYREVTDADYRRAMAAREAATAEAPVQDAEYEEVKDNDTDSGDGTDN